MAFHWDGLNTDITEVGRSSALGDGATPKSLPIADLQKLQDWILDLKPPPYPADRFPIDPRDRGGVLDCDFRVHGTNGLRVVDASVFPGIPGFFIVSAVYRSPRRPPMRCWPNVAEPATSTC